MNGIDAAVLRGSRSVNRTAVFHVCYHAKINFFVCTHVYFVTMTYGRILLQRCSVDRI